MLGIHNLPLFLLASITLTLIPGPATLYIVGRSVSQGRTAGVMSVLGIGLGSLCHTLAVACGVAVLLAASQAAFNLIKLAGAAYLIALGIQSLLAKPLTSPEALATARAEPATASPLRLFAQGTFTQLLNPKVTLFFVALLPQFVRVDASHRPIPYLALGSLFVAIDTAWFLAIACGSAKVSSWLRRSTRVQTTLRRATGLLYIALGLNLLRAQAGKSLPH